MRFLADAQFPRRLVRLLRDAGFDAIHTLDLPLGNRTTDTEINTLSIREQYIVVTKDADFVNTFHLHHTPYKLLLVSTGKYQELGTGRIVRGESRDHLKRFRYIRFHRNKPQRGNLSFLRLLLI